MLDHMTTQRIPCTPSERLLAYIHEVGHGEGMLNAVARCDGRLETARVKQSLQRLQARHAKLRSALQKDDAGNWWFEVSPQPPCIPIVERPLNGEQTWEQHVLHERPGPFALGTAPLAKLSLLQPADGDHTWLVFWLHHSIADAQSAWLLINELVQFSADASLADTPAPDGFGVVPPGRWDRPRDRLRLAGRLLRYVIGNRLKRMAMPPFDASPPGAIAHSQWTVDESAALVAGCRERNVRVTALLHSATVLSLSDVFDWPGRHIGCVVPLKIRSQLGVSEETIGTFVSTTRLNVRCPAKDADIWNVAQAIQTQGDQLNQRHDPVVSVAMTGLLPLSPRFLGKRGSAVAVNNLGRLSAPAVEGHQIADYTCLVTAQHAGAALSLHFATIADRLCITLRSECLSDVTLARLHERFCHRLRAIGLETGTP